MVSFIKLNSYISVLCVNNYQNSSKYLSTKYISEKFHAVICYNEMDIDKKKTFNSYCAQFYSPNWIIIIFFSIFTVSRSDHVGLLLLERSQCGYIYVCVCWHNKLRIRFHTIVNNSSKFNLIALIRPLDQKPRWPNKRTAYQLCDFHWKPLIHRTIQRKRAVENNHDTSIFVFAKVKQKLLSLFLFIELSLAIIRAIFHIGKRRNLTSSFLRNSIFREKALSHNYFQRLKYWRMVSIKANRKLD